MKLNELITQYVTFRQSMGEDFKSSESLLMTFCRRMGAEIDINDVQTEQVEVFLTGTGTLSGYWRRKYDLLRGLYHYAISRGLVAHAPLPITVPQPPQRFIPYIYTEDELRRLFSAATSCRKVCRKLEPHTLRAILVLLYGAGLRISEAVALTVADVDSASAVITVRNTKFHKTRLVPLGSQLNQVITDYATRRDQAGHSQSGSAPFFILRRGGRVSVQLVEQVFRCVREAAGVSRDDGARYQPRLHDMRQNAEARKMPHEGV
jgi:integrase/recombinase XerD